MISCLNAVNIQNFQAFHSYFFARILLFMQLFPSIPGGMANNVDPDKTTPSAFRIGLTYLHCLYMPFCHKLLHAKLVYHS